MSIANKYNRTSPFIHNGDVPENAPFVKLEDLKDVKEPITILTMWINTKSEYGDHPVIGTATGKVDIPKGYTRIVKEMMQDDEVISAVNAGKLGFIVRPYHSEKFHRDCYAVDFVDL